MTAHGHSRRRASGARAARTPTPESAERADPARRSQVAGRDLRPLVRAAIALALLWGALFAPQLVAGRVFVLGDARVYQPFAEFSRERWAEQRVRTFWNPYVLCGVAASASLADMRPQYLPDAALDLVEAVRPGRWVPLLGPLLAHLLGMIAVAAIAWLQWDLRATALVWAGVAYGFCTLLLVPFAFGHTAFLVACALLPVQLHAVLLLFGARRRLPVAGAALALAAVTGVQGLTGHPQVVVYSGLLAAAFAIERAVRLRRFMRLGMAIGSLAWGAAIAAAVWLPAIHYGDYSNRAGGVSLEQVRRMSLAWHEVATLAWPRAVGGAGRTYWGGLWNTDYPRFLGTLVVAFALIAALRRGARPTGTGFLVGIVLVSVALAMGPRLGPVYAWLFRSLPFFESFRVTSMGLIVAALGVALLSAFVFVRADGRPPWGIAGRAGRNAAVVVGGALVLGVALWFGAFDSLYTGFAMAMRPKLDFEPARAAAHAAGSDLAWRALLLGAGLLLLRGWHARQPWRVAEAALVLLLGVDLLAVSLPTLVRATAPPGVMHHPDTPVLARVGAEHPEGRVLSLRTYDVSKWQVSSSERSAELRINDWIRWRAKAYGGEHGTPPATWGGLELLQSLNAWRAVGITFVNNVPGAPMDTSTAEPIASGRDEVVYRLRRALGRAYAVPRVTALASDAAAFARLVEPTFDPAREAITTEREAAGDYPGSAGCAIQWLRDEPDTVALEVRAPDRSFVVVADSHFPGWEATLDGTPVPIHRVQHMVRGVAVPAGTHRLTMTFVPEGWRAALPVTRAAMGAWVIAAIGWLGLAIARLGRRARAHP
jgi:hypothetical protein